MEAVNEYVVMVERSGASREEKIKKLSEELEESGVGKKVQAEIIHRLREDLQKARGEREAHAAAVISQRARADEVEATRD